MRLQVEGMRPTSAFVRQNSFLQMRDRNKSMDGGVLRPSVTNSSLPQPLLHENSFSQYRPPLDYNIFNWLAAKLNKARVKLKSHENKYWIKAKKVAAKIVESLIFKLFMMVIVVVHAVVLGFYQPEVMRDLRPVNELISYIVIGFLLVYCLEAALNMVAYGVLLTPNVSYFRRPVFIMDITVIIFGVLYLSLRSHEPVLAEFFSSLMTLKLIRILTLSKSVRFMLKALAKSVQPLFYLSVLTFLCILFFALLGIELFQGELHGGCFANYTTPAGTNKSVLVSNFPCNLERGPNSSNIGDHVCPDHSQCSFWKEGPFESVVSFDDVYRSFVLVFQVITLEGWSGVFFLVESSVGHAYAWVYFVFVIVLGSVLILNLWIGVLTIVFVDVSEKEQEHGNKRRLIEEKRIDKDMMQYNDWLRRGAELTNPSDTGSIDRSRYLYGYGVSSQTDKDLEYFEEEKFEDEEGVYGEEKKKRCGCYRYTRRRVYWVVRSNVWFWGDMLAHIVNLILLMSLHFPSNPAFDQTIYILNYIFTFIYIMDVVLRMYGMGLIHFLTDNRDSLSLTISSRVIEVPMALLGLVALIVFIPIPRLRDFQLPVLLNAVWCTKIILIGKISEKNWARVKEVLKTLASLIKVILSLMALIGLFLYLFTIAGIRLFGNRLNLTGFIQPNFDDMVNSFYLVFQLLTTEDWHNVFYSTVSAFVVQNGEIGIIASLYFLIAITLGAFILVNAFLALSVDKLSEIRDLEEDASKEKESEEKERKQREEQLSALKNPKVEVRRRTIRQLLRFQAHNPSERVRGISNKRRRWWGQLSMPYLKRQTTSLEFKRSASTPHESVSSFTDDLRGRKLSAIEEETRGLGGVSRRRNPLSLVDEPPGFGIEPAADSAAFQTAASSRMARMKKLQSPPPPIMEGDEEGEGESGIWKPRQMSIVSSPPDPIPTRTQSGRQLSMMSAEMMVVRPTRRFQSLPIGSEAVFCPIPEVLSDDGSASVPMGSAASETPDLPVSGSADSANSSNGHRKLSRQESIHDDEPAAPGLTSAPHPRPHDLPSPPHPPSSSVAADQFTVDLTHRYTRGSSLEPIQVHQPVIRRVRESVSRTTRNKLEEKVSAAWNWMKEYFGSLHFDPSKEMEKIPPHSAFFILDHNNTFRKVCFRLVKSQAFLTISYAVILLSSIVLMLEVPNGVRVEDSTEFCAVQLIVVWVDVALLAFFLVDMALKMISLGVIVHRDSYLRGFFNFIDFTVTILTLIPIIYFFVKYDQRKTQSETGVCISYGYDRVLPPFVGTLRVFRVLRPFRAIRISGLYLAVTGLFSSFKAMLTIFFLDGLIVIIFAVLGVFYFRGSFFFCTDPVIEIEDECNGYFFKYDYTFGSNRASNLSVPGLVCPVSEQRVWTQHGLNFDHIGNATVTLFTMLTAEGWQNVMYSGINSRRPNNSRTALASILENNRAAALYYILYMIIMTFILLQLFVGFVIVTFQEVGVKTFRETKLNKNQRNCLHFALTARPIVRPNYNFQQKVRKKVMPWIDSLPMRAAIVIALLINTIVLSVQTYKGPIETIYWLNAVCTILFALEAAAKFIILTPPIYFKEPWNAFAFLVALGSLIEFTVQQALPTGSQPLPFSHIASTFRVLRLLEFIPQVKRILWTVRRSLELFPWIGYLLIIIIYTYSVIGMHVFGTVEQASVDESEERGIHQYNNFGTFPNAMALMLRVVTGENWQDVMLNSLGGQPCQNSTLVAEDDTCGNDFAYFFFISFYFISTIMILNLFVAIIMDNFEYIVWDKSQLGAYDLGVFVRQWAKYDKPGDGKLRPEKVFDLLRKINPPVGWGKLCPRVSAYKKMMRLNIPILVEKMDGVDVKMVTFNATLFALVKTTLEIDCKGCADCKRRCNNEIREKLDILFPDMPKKRFDEVLAKETDETVADEYAALLVQAEWRSFMLRRRRIVDIFKGSERRLLVHREFQDPGPDLIKERPLSTFNHDLEMLEIPATARKVSESTSAGTDRSRMGSLSPLSVSLRSPVSSPMPLLEPSGLEFLMEQPYSRQRYTFSTSPTSPMPTQVTKPPPLQPTTSEDKKSDGDDLSFASAHSNPFSSQESLSNNLMESTV